MSLVCLKAEKPGRRRNRVRVWTESRGKISVGAGRGRSGLQPKRGVGPGEDQVIPNPLHVERDWGDARKIGAGDGGEGETGFEIVNEDGGAYAGVLAEIVRGDGCCSGCVSSS